MGYNAVGAVIYEPRLLVNNKLVGKPTMTYTFRNILDFQYGLEWQICTWMWKFLNNGATQDSLIGSAEDMAQELDDLAGMSESKYLTDFERQFDSFWMDEPIWRKVCSGLKEEFPLLPSKPRATSEPSPPRRLSLLSVPNPSS